MGEIKKKFSIQKDGSIQVLKQRRVTESDKEKEASALSVATTFGYALVIPLVGGVVLGKVLDERFGSSPKLTLLFLFIGLVVGIATLYKEMKGLFE